MRRSIKHIIALVFIAFSLTSIAQDATLSLSASSNTVAVGQSFRVTVSLNNGKVESYKDPSFKGFRIIGKSSSSGSGGMTIIVNGQPMNSGGNGSASWTYTLLPLQTGTYQIGPAKAKISGKWISSNTASIDVRKGSNNQQHANNNTQNNTNNNNNQNTNTATGSDNALFLRAEVDNQHPYQGEQLIVTYKLYTSIPVLQYVIEESPAFTGFWMENLLDNKADPVQYETTLNGKQYAVAEIRKLALFAQQSGNLQLDPQKLKCLVQIQTKSQSYNPFADFFKDDPFANDPFFQQMFQMSGISTRNEERELASNPVKIYVKDLPGGAPESFEGAVGNFSIDTEFDKKSSYSTNEAITIKYTIKGKGNFALIDNLPLEFPKEFDTYEPEIRESLKRSNAGISGKKEFEYVVIPRVKGKYEIPALKFSYFDVATKSYVKLETEAIRLNVNKGKDSDAAISGSNDIEYINEDIRFIKTDNKNLQSKGSSFYASSLYFIFLAAPILAFILFIILWRKRIKDNANIVDYRRRKANKMASKHLKTAKKLLQNMEEEAFYQEISRALWGYISHKLSIAVSELSMDNIREALKEKQIKDVSIELFLKTLNDCEFARFAPGDSKANMQAVYESSVRVILNIEEEIR